MGTILIVEPSRSGAAISSCGRFRFVLWRTWGEADEWGKPRRAANFIMLNPSTADASKDDQTIRRCIGFAKRWGLDGITVTNLYPFRATHPRDLWKAEDREGPWAKHSLDRVNDRAIIGHAKGAAVVVCAWGANAKEDRSEWVLDYLIRRGIEPRCLGTTKGGQPLHPLRLPNRTEPQWYPRVDHA